MGVGRGLELVENLGDLGEEVVGGGSVAGANGRGRLEREGPGQPDGQASCRQWPTARAKAAAAAAS
jgi:hypothetical protein